MLARTVASDVDLPPFEKSAMDGFAVRAADFEGAAGPVSLALVGESKAGAPFAGRVERGACVAIYTGAEVPADCDSVVIVEKSRQEGSHVVLDDRPRLGQHVCRRGEDLRVDQEVFTSGRRLSAIDLAVLAAVGCDPVPVFERPRVAVLTTGDELVRPRERPRSGQIREGNTIYLAARAAAAGANVENLGIVPDDPAVLEARFEAALASCDALITTGGVSMGKYDLVGGVLERLGVEPVFHKVAIRPGKPVWFGMHGRVPVFALPGNPVSCLLGFELFVRPALARMEGALESEQREHVRVGRWLGKANAPNVRQQNLPITVRSGADGVDELSPLAWTSSADIVGLAKADGLVVIEIGAVVEPGALVRWRPLSGAVYGARHDSAAVE